MKEKILLKNKKLRICLAFIIFFIILTIIILSLFNEKGEKSFKIYNIIELYKYVQ